MRGVVWGMWTALGLSACGAAAPAVAPTPDSVDTPVLLEPLVEVTPPAFAAPLPVAWPTLIRDATIMTAAGAVCPAVGFAWTRGASLGSVRGTRRPRPTVSG